MAQFPLEKKIYISWSDFHQHTKELCKKIKEHGHFDKIVAVSRGGLIPAGVIAYELNIRNNEAVNFSSYDNHYNRRDDEDIEISGHVGNVNEKTLIIDDLSDSGRTFKILKAVYPQACFVSVYAKEQGADITDIFAKKMPDEWIVFPWDVEEE